MLDQAFLFERSINIDTYDRHADRVREQMTLLNTDEHTSKLEEWTWKAFCELLFNLQLGASRRELIIGPQSTHGGKGHVLRGSLAPVLLGPGLCTRRLRRSCLRFRPLR